MPEYIEYHIIETHYLGMSAARTKVPYINHINDGLKVLDVIGASEFAKRAYCLHPLFQSDESLQQIRHEPEGQLIIGGRLYQIMPFVVMCAVEYRSIANQYLSTRSISSIEEIALSPLPDVNDMLIADKVQNRKDFEQHHLGVHPRSQQLEQYFKNWLQRLGISEDRYQTIKSDITA